MNDRNHKSITRFFAAMSFSIIVLSIKIEIKGFTVIETLRSLFFTFWYLFTVSIWVGLVGMMCADMYEEIKKNGNKNLNKLYIIND